jgi:hypothetical protein
MPIKDLPPDARKRLASGLPTTVAWEMRRFIFRRKFAEGFAFARIWLEWF